jgi:hypothetical protein
MRGRILASHSARETHAAIAEVEYFGRAACAIIVSQTNFFALAEVVTRRRTSQVG